MKAVIFLVFALLGRSAPAEAATNSHPWMAYGDLRGQIAPCGCDPSTDLGGLARLARAITETRDTNPDVWLFSLGNNLPREIDAAKLQTMLAAEATLNPMATLLRPVEWAALDAIAAAREQRKDQRPYYVLSNLKMKSPQVDYVRLASGLVVMGYAVIPDVTRSFGGALEKEWRGFLKRHGAATKVLLFAGSDKDLAAIRKTGLFDIVIAANTTPDDALPSPIEKAEPGRLLRAESVHAVPVFGQGILRGGKLRGMRPLADLLDKCPPGPTCLEKTSLMSGGEELVTWLDRSWEGTHPLTKVLDAYRASAALAFDAKAEERKKDLQGTPFAGSAACQTCHAKEYEIWRKSKHARAFPTLVAKKQEKDAECVGCHVLGWDTKGGFVSPEASPQFQNVNCENCHGPRLAHTTNPTIKVPSDPKGVCVSCHQGPHSPGFDFAKYWKEIQHP